MTRKNHKLTTILVTAAVVAGTGIEAALPANAVAFQQVPVTATSLSSNRAFGLRGKPRLSGNVRVGATVEAVGKFDAFSPRPTSFRYQWFRGNWAIPGATNRTYTLRAADEGREISVRVTAVRAGFNDRNVRSQARVVQPRSGNAGGNAGGGSGGNAGGNAGNSGGNAGGTNAVISSERAAEIALAFIGAGRVTWIERENDYGAAWEVEITLPDRREVDVYVSANGTVVNTSPRSWMNR